MSEHTVLAHHFEDLEQQREASTLGMWVFLANEVLFFGALFVAFLAYRALYPAAFAEASRHLNVALAGLNTAVLLCSSLTMALAVHAVQVDERRALLGFLSLTMVLGAIFLGIKGLEYYQEFQEQLIPGLNFAFEGTAPQQAQLFFVLYFTMTGLHALHLAIGIGVVGVMAIRAWGRSVSAGHYMPVELTGLYWHFVDVVWVFLFPLLYLIDLQA